MSQGKFAISAQWLSAGSILVTAFAIYNALYNNIALTIIFTAIALMLWITAISQKLMDKLDE